MKASNISRARRLFLRRSVTIGGGLAVASLGQSVEGLARMLRGQRSDAPAFGTAETPAIITSERMRPRIPSGVQSGDATLTGGGDARALVWSRTDLPADMTVEWDTTPRFTNVRRVPRHHVTAATDFTGQIDLTGLPPGQDIFYRVRFEVAGSRDASEPLGGHFRTPSSDPRDLVLVWGGDTAGQGWGIDAARGGMRTYEAMRRLEPDLFVHSGDLIYADNPILPEVKLTDGSVWRNLVTEETAKVAETIEEFRGRYRYNLLDENVRRFHADVSMIAQWDDHEVRNNWYPSQVLDDPRYRVRDVGLLAARARQAYLEYVPIRRTRNDRHRIHRVNHYGPLVDLFVLDERSYRGPNTANTQERQNRATEMLGPGQIEWLRHELARSRATWKVIASDMPLGLVVADGETAQEGWANGRPQALGRELELLGLLGFIKTQGIDNVVWITADVHYAAAHHYDPERATFHDFSPFWEFVAGPLHAGTFGPGTLDSTFGPEVRFTSLPASGANNRPPSDGLQFFGAIRVAAATRAMTVTLHNQAGERLFSVDLTPDA
ncbi:MAG: alkaline phosphatase D family protein [Vicinamibacteraceae bacterium]